MSRPDEDMRPRLHYYNIVPMAVVFAKAIKHFSESTLSSFRNIASVRKDFPGSIVKVTNSRKLKGKK